MTGKYWTLSNLNPDSNYTNCTSCAVKRDHDIVNGNFRAISTRQEINPQFKAGPIILDMKYSNSVLITLLSLFQYGNCYRKKNRDVKGTNFIR